MSIHWTRKGKAMAAVALVTSVAGLLTSTVALAAVAGAVWLTLAVDRSLVPDHAPDIQLDVFPRRVHEGDEVSIRASKARHRSGQHVRARLPGPFALRHGSDLLEGRGPWRLVCQSPVRGAWSIGPADVRSDSPIGLWVRHEVKGRTCPVDVLPRPMSVDDIALANRALRPVLGRFMVNRPGQGFDFFALREYQSSDSIRDVNWKASAKSEDLIVNQRIRETQTEVVVVVDARDVTGVGPVGDTVLDRACRIAAGLAEDAVAQRDKMVLVTHGSSTEAAAVTDRTGLMRIQEKLAQLTADGDAGLAAAWRDNAPRLAGRGPVFIVHSGEADDDLVDALSRIAASGHPVTWFCPTMHGLDRSLDARRRRRRSAVLEQARNLGIAVVDWDGGAPVAPEPMVVA